jgi:hypothetical protein
MAAFRSKDSKTAPEGSPQKKNPKNCVVVFSASTVWASAPHKAHTPVAQLIPAGSWNCFSVSSPQATATRKEPHESVSKPTPIDQFTGTPLFLL